MPLVAEVVARFVADTKQFTAGVAQIEAQTVGLRKQTANLASSGKQMEATASRGVQSLGLLGARHDAAGKAVIRHTRAVNVFNNSALINAGRMGGVAESLAKTVGFQSAAALGWTALGAAAVVGISKAVMAASDLNEAINKAQVQFEDAAPAVLKFATNSAKIGLAKTEAIGAAAAFGAMFQTAGLANTESARMSISMVKLAADMASFNNEDPSDMLMRIRSGLAGEAEPLRRFGVFISETRVQQEAWRLGIAKTGVQLTDQQKILARYALILKDTAKQQGDFARTAGSSLPNQLRILRAEVTNLAADVGKDLLPAGLQLVRAFRSGVEAARPLLQVLAGLLAQATRLAPVAVELLKAWLAYKAVTFLPGLLLKVAVGLEALHLKAAASGALSAAAGLEAIAGSAGLIAAGAITTLPLWRRLIHDLTTGPSEIAASFNKAHKDSVQITAKMLSDIRAQVSSFSWKGATGTVEKASGIIGELGQGLIDAGMSAAEANRIIARAVATSTHLIGGFGGGLNEFRAMLQQNLDAALKAWQQDHAAMEKSAKDALDGVGVVYHRNTALLKRFVQQTGGDWRKFREQSIAAATGTADDQRNFVNDIRRAYNDWRATLADDLNFVKGSLGELANTNKLTGAKILKVFNDQLKAMGNYRADWRKVSKVGGDAATNLLSSIAGMGQQGAGILHALANSNDAQIRRIVRRWNRAHGDATDLATVIQKDLVGSIRDLIAAIQGIPNWKKIDFGADTGAARAAIDKFIRDYTGRVIGLRIGTRVVVHGGGLIMHGGGAVPAYHDGGGVSPHAGLRPDERPAVLQVGEFVVNRRATQAYLGELMQMNRLHNGGGVVAARPVPVPTMSGRGDRVVEEHVHFHGDRWKDEEILSKMRFVWATRGF